MNKALAILALFLSPIFVLPVESDSIRLPKLLLVLVIGATIFLIKVLNSKKISVGKGNIPLSILCFFLYVSIQGLVLRPVTEALFQSFILFTFLCIALEFIKISEDPLLSKAIHLLTWIMLIYGTLQILRFDPIFKNYDPSIAHLPTGFLGHRTLFGPFMAMLMSYHLAYGKYKIALFSCLMGFATASAMTLFTIIICFCVFLWLRKKTFYAIIILICSGLSGSIGFIFREKIHFFAEKGRFLAWEFTLTEGLKNPVFGYGIGSYKDIFAKKYQVLLGYSWQQAHNELLQAFFELGLFGVLLIAWIFTDFIFSAREKNLNKNHEAWLLIAVAGMANSLGNFPFHIAPLALYSLCGWMLIANERN